MSSKEYISNKPRSDDQVRVLEDRMRKAFAEERVEFNEASYAVQHEHILKATRRSTVSAVTTKDTKDRGLILKRTNGKHQGFHTVREIISLIKSQSSRVVKVKSWGFDGTHLWILLEICPTTLDKFVDYVKLLAKAGGILLTDRISISKVILDKLIRAIRKMHTFLICHRDLKGDNVLMTIFGELLLTDLDLAALLKTADELMNSEVGNDFYKMIRNDPSNSKVPPKLMPATDFPNAAAMVAEVFLPFKGSFHGEAILAHFIFDGSCDEDPNLQKFAKFLMRLRCVSNEESLELAFAKYGAAAVPSVNDHQVYETFVKKFFTQISKTELLAFLSISRQTYFWPRLAALEIRDDKLIKAIMERQPTIASKVQPESKVKVLLRELYQSIDEEEKKIKGALQTPGSKGRSRAQSAATPGPPGKKPHQAESGSDWAVERTKVQVALGEKLRQREIMLEQGQRTNAEFFEDMSEDEAELESEDNKQEAEQEDDSEEAEDENDDNDDDDDDDDDDNDDDDEEEDSENEAEKSKRKQALETARSDKVLFNQCIKLMRKTGLQGDSLYSYHTDCPVDECKRQIYVGEDASCRKAHVLMNHNLRNAGLGDKIYVASGPNPKFCNDKCCRAARKR